MPGTTASTPSLEFQDAAGQTRSVAYADIYQMIYLDVAVRNGAGDTMGSFSLKRIEAGGNPGLLLQGINNIALGTVTADFQLVIDGRPVGALITFLERFQ